MGEATQLLKQSELEIDQLAKQWPELASTLAEEIRCLRGILHVVICDMTIKLRAA